MMAERPLPREFHDAMASLDRINRNLARWSLWWPKVVE